METLPATSPAQPEAASLSLVQLTRLQEEVLRLREHLRAALLTDSPQVEMLVYTAFFRLYRDFFVDVLRARRTSARIREEDAPYNPESTDACGRAVSAEARFVASSYTQDVLAACLYLADVRTLSEVHPIADAPPSPADAGNEANVSTAYVSATQRGFCARVFLHLCWSDASLPLRDVLHALYPLLDARATMNGDHGTTAQEGAAAAENAIAANLFAQPRFANRKRLLAETLTGLVLFRPNGVLALLRVLLLNDRVEESMTREAAQLVVRVLTAPPHAVWRRHDLASKSESTAEGAVGSYVQHEVTLSVEAQVQAVAPQLLALLGEQASAGEKDTPSRAQTTQADSRPRFLARLEALQQRLPAETLEQRLHLFCTLYLNTLVRLPPRTSPEFARCYRQFFYTNKYILTPGLDCLSLYEDKTPRAMVEDEVVVALHRLTTLVQGVALGAGTAALTQVLPATAPGILNLCALQRASSTREGRSILVMSEATDTKPEGQQASSVALHQFLQALLSHSSLYELAAHTLVQACLADRPHAFCRQGNTAEASLSYANTPCTSLDFTLGLSWLLSDATTATVTAPVFVHACIEAIVDACQTELHAAGVDALASAPGNGESREVEEGDVVASPSSSSAQDPPLLQLLERLCLEAPSEAIFGAAVQLSLVSTLTLLGRMLSLSVVLCRWALGLLEALLASESLRSGVASSDHVHLSESKEEQRQLARFARTCQGVLSTLRLLQDTQPAHRATAAWLSSEDPALVALLQRVQLSLERCEEDVTKRLQSYIGKGNGSTVASPSATGEDREAVLRLTAEWQRQHTQLQSALDSRATAEVSIILAALCRSIDEAVHDVAQPTPLFPSVQSLVLSLVRVLYESDEVGAAVRAVHGLTWLSMYRFDSKDSSFMAEVVWAVLGEAQLPPWLASPLGHTRPATSLRGPQALRLCRLRVRLLDVLLSWTDYDAEARTLHNVDDVLRHTHHVSLFEVLVRLCHSSTDAPLLVSTLHLVGAYTVAMQPRVPLAAVCDLCRDVFRLSPYEMAKAACAAALGQVVAALCQPENASLPLLTEVDVGTVQTLAAAMSSYRGRPAAPPASPSREVPSTEADSMDLHDAVIRQHGLDMLRLLREASQSLGSPTAAAAAAEPLIIVKR